MSECVLCYREEKSESEHVLCSLCVQRLLLADDETKIRLRDKLTEHSRSTAAKMVESFIEGERYDTARRLRTESSVRGRFVQNPEHQTGNSRTSKVLGRLSVRETRTSHKSVPGRFRVCMAEG